MHSRLNILILVIITIAVSSTVADNNGKYVPRNDHKYIHIPDRRELGRYIHIPYPYDGGYGPYFGKNIPYDYDPTGEYSSKKYQTVSSPNAIDPFTTNEYDIPTPKICLVYGFPQSSNQLDIYELATDDQNLENPNVPKTRIRKSIFDSQTEPTTTTTQRPRTRYDDEGKWKIIRQDENKQKKKYQYLYETENGIYAEEQGIIKKQKNNAEGTNGQGFYQYTGDDGKIYRVEYTVGEQGFIPKGDHLPVAPPIPDQIKRSLEWIKRKNSL